MNNLSQDQFRNYLMSHGIPGAVDIENVISGFNLALPVYLQSLEAGTSIYQFVRRPSLKGMSPRLGNWFCLTGAMAHQLAIFGGLAGRGLQQFQVVMDLVAVEGTAAPMTRDWKNEIGGDGGTTQIYVPPSLLGHLRSLGPVDD